MPKQPTTEPIDEGKLPSSPNKIADLAAEAALDGNHARAEHLYLVAASRAAARGATSRAYPTDAARDRENAKEWDKCAARERRLVQLKAGES